MSETTKLNDSAKWIPTSSQTVGPYFRIGLQSLAHRMSELEAGPDAIEIRGKVFDSEGEPVPDAMVEFWGAAPTGAYSGVQPGANGFPAGFYRAPTGKDGEFSFSIGKPGPAPAGDGRIQAPHFLVLFFARGLLRNMLTRVYFEGEPANDLDPVLAVVPAERRHTLIARADKGTKIYNWNIVLQGKDETVFFDW
jgi:protocatechuate 3,4-dioxygenase alpha subunit